MWMRRRYQSNQNIQHFFVSFFGVLFFSVAAIAAVKSGWIEDELFHRRNWTIQFLVESKQKTSSVWMWNSKTYCSSEVGRLSSAIAAAVNSSSYRFWWIWNNGNKHFTKKKTYSNGSYLTRGIQKRSSKLENSVLVRCPESIEATKKKSYHRKDSITGEKERQRRRWSSMHGNWIYIKKEPFKSTVCWMCIHLCV